MINELIEISRMVGMRNDYVQAGGGNNSVKLDENYMAIKSSGYLLSDMKKNDGYTIIQYQKIKEMLLDGVTSEKEILEASHISGKKASIEVFLHAFCKKYTVHIHSLLSNILLAKNNCQEEIKTLFPDSVCIDYKTPGVELAQEMIKKYKEEEIIFLKNHGLIVTSDNYDRITELIHMVDSKISKYLGINFDKFNHVSEIYQFVNKYSDDLVFLSEDIDIYKALEKNEFKLWNYRFCPDCIVYCGPKELEISHLEEKAFKEHIANYGKITIVVYDKNVYICANTLKRAREIESVLSFSAKIFLNNQNNQLDYLSEEEVDKLYHSDFEKYRQNMK